MSITWLEINRKFQSQFCDRIPKFSRNLATFSLRVSSRRIFTRLFALHFPVSGLAKQNMSPQFLCVVTFLFRKSRGKNKLQICDFSRYFSRKGKKKFTRKYDCIGRNFEPHLILKRDACWCAERVIFLKYYLGDYSLKHSHVALKTVANLQGLHNIISLEEQNEPWEK